MGAMALAAIEGRSVASEPPAVARSARAKRVIYLHMAGSPPQHELFDWKPKLVEYNMKECPAELLKGQRFAFIKGTPKLLGTPYRFAQHGQSGAWISELLPEFSQVADEVTFLKGMWTDQFNHAPAELLLFSGASRFGNPGLGSWITYGLGSENADLPSYVVMVTGGSDPSAGKALWSSGFLPSVYQGVQCRSGGEPILFANDPPGVTRQARRRSLDAIREINERELELFGDPETTTRISQYELAYRMQVSVPDVMSLAGEDQETLDLYGAKPGAASFANNCLLARRLVERGVRFVQLFDWGWDIHGTSALDDIMGALPKKCRDVDRPLAALLIDLKRRGMLDETLVIWSGEFGRTSMNEARGGSTFLGRDHHPHSFSMWMAGGGIKPGMTYGATDELGYFPVENKTSVRDLQATILHLMGLDPYAFHFRYQGLRQRLIGPSDEGQIIRSILA
ncbi:DUF1501 domain-containing protein [bacterium]|nr:DUF1501 domain-containing protein [bacterium]